MKGDQSLKTFYNHTSKSLLESGCLSVSLCPTFWVPTGLEIGMFASPYIQRVNQRTKRNQFATRYRGYTIRALLVGTTVTS